MWAFTKSQSLLWKATDWLTIGGLSVLILPVFFILQFSEQQLTNLGWIMYGMAFLVNYPHFMVSYQLLYADHKKYILTQPAYFWAAIIVPILLIGYFVSAVVTEHLSWLSWGVQVMFILVGWHYTKQAYGVVMVTAAKSGYYFTKWEKYALKFNMYSLWLTSMSSFNIGPNTTLSYWDIPYASLNLSKNWLYTGYFLTGVSLMVVIVLLARKIMHMRVLPPLDSCIGFISIYAWYLPLFSHPGFFLMIPFFHAVQYFTFVGAFKKNEMHVLANKNQTKKVIAYFLVSILLGVFSFEIAPRILDVGIPYNHSLFGQGLFLFCFSVAINIHHYFIDNVIWRANNPEVRSYLFAK